MLRFLSGDNWILAFRDGGLTPPTNTERRRLRNWQNLGDIDRICLFSGGLDSLVGAIDCLSDAEYRTLFVSRASPGDQMYQKYLLGRLGNPPSFSVNDVPTRPKPTIAASWDKEDTTRSRSILFIALAACLASAVSADGSECVDLLIPENGVIALNPPLSPRRRGALSTRTAHPHYLRGLQEIFDAAGIAARLINPYQFMTKGEMITSCAEQTLIRTLAKFSVSCGKWKRKNKQCGKCLPCLIRLAALHSAGISEPDHSYQYYDLQAVIATEKHKADLEAVICAIQSYGPERIGRWVSSSGPLPLESSERQKYYDVAAKGLAELDAFLRSRGINP